MPVQQNHPLQLPTLQHISSSLCRLTRCSHCTKVGSSRFYCLSCRRSSCSQCRCCDAARPDDHITEIAQTARDIYNTVHSIARPLCFAMLRVAAPVDSLSVKLRLRLRRARHPDSQIFSLLPTARSTPAIGRGKVRNHSINSNLSSSENHFSVPLTLPLRNSHSQQKAKDSPVLLPKTVSSLHRPLLPQSSGSQPIPSNRESTSSVSVPHSQFPSNSHAGPSNLKYHSPFHLSTPSDLSDPLTSVRKRSPSSELHVYPANIHSSQPPSKSANSTATCAIQRANVSQRGNKPRTVRNRAEARDDHYMHSQKREFESAPGLTHQHCLSERIQKSEEKSEENSLQAGPNVSLAGRVEEISQRYTGVSRVSVAGPALKRRRRAKHTAKLVSKNYSLPDDEQLTNRQTIENTDLQKFNSSATNLGVTQGGCTLLRRNQQKLVEYRYPALQEKTVNESHNSDDDIDIEQLPFRTDQPSTKKFASASLYTSVDMITLERQRVSKRPRPSTSSAVQDVRKLGNTPTTGRPVSQLHVQRERNVRPLNTAPNLATKTSQIGKRMAGITHRFEGSRPSGKPPNDSVSQTPETQPPSPNTGNRALLNDGNRDVVAMRSSSSSPSAPPGRLQRGLLESAHSEPDFEKERGSNDPFIIDSGVLTKERRNSKLLPTSTSARVEVPTHHDAAAPSLSISKQFLKRLDEDDTVNDPIEDNCSKESFENPVVRCEVQNPPPSKLSFPPAPSLSPRLSNSHDISHSKLGASEGVVETDEADAQGKVDDQNINRTIEGSSLKGDFSDKPSGEVYLPRAATTSFDNACDAPFFNSFDIDRGLSATPSNKTFASVLAPKSTVEQNEQSTQRVVKGTSLLVEDNDIIEGHSPCEPVPAEAAEHNVDVTRSTSKRFGKCIYTQSQGDCSEGETKSANVEGSWSSKKKLPPRVLESENTGNTDENDVIIPESVDVELLDRVKRPVDSSVKKCRSRRTDYNSDIGGDKYLTRSGECNEPVKSKNACITSTMKSGLSASVNQSPDKVVCMNDVLATEKRDEVNIGATFISGCNDGSDKVDYVGAMVVCLVSDGMTNEEHDLIYELITRLGGEVVTDYWGAKPECVVARIVENYVEELPTVLLMARAGCVPIVEADWVIQSYLKGIWLPLRQFRTAQMTGLSERVFENIIITVTAPITIVKHRRLSLTVITAELISGLRMSGAIVHFDEDHDLKNFERMGCGRVCIYLVEQVHDKSRKRSTLESQWRWADSDENAGHVVVANASWAWKSIKCGKLYGVDDEIKMVGRMK